MSDPTTGGRPTGTRRRVPDAMADELPVEPTFSVLELVEVINGVLERTFGGGVWVRGEIDRVVDRGPHTYFSLVEDGDRGRAALDVQLFAPAKKRIRPVLEQHRLELTAGTEVRIFGRPDVYAPSGRLGFKMADIDPRFTLGGLAAERDRVVRRLVAEGLYDANRRCELALLPLRIGIVTSVGTAAWHDLRDELDRSGLGFELRIADVRVQGERAVEMVTAGIRTLSRHRDLDAIVVVRGGGARNELATFDAEPIARAIAACPIPVLTGLGHEIDRSIADEVAHTAYKTPTACAVALVERVRAAVQAAENAWTGIERRVLDMLDRASAHLDRTARAIGRRTIAAVDRADERLDGRAHRLHRAAVTPLTGAERRLDHAASVLVTRAPRLLTVEQRHVDSLAARVALLDPEKLLARGWSITTTADGRLVRRPDDAPPGSILHTRIAAARLLSRVVDPDVPEPSDEPHRAAADPSTPTEV